MFRFQSAPCRLHQVSLNINFCKKRLHSDTLFGDLVWIGVYISIDIKYKTVPCNTFDKYTVITKTLVIVYVPVHRHFLRVRYQCKNLIKYNSSINDNLPMPMGEKKHICDERRVKVNYPASPSAQTNRTRDGQ